MRVMPIILLLAVLLLPACAEPVAPTVPPTAPLAAPKLVDTPTSIPTAAPAPAPTDTPSPPPPASEGEVTDTQSFQNYTIRIYQKTFDEGYFEVLQDGEPVFRQDGYGWFYISPPAKTSSDPISMGSDITGDGIPNLVVSNWAGGAHCCLELSIFELGPVFRQIGQINAGHSDQAHFEDLDGDGALEFLTNDWTFAYWKTSFADSPAPRVILRYQADGYHLAPDLMHTPPPSDDELQQQAQAIESDAAWSNGSPPPALWRTMLDLIYSGHTDLTRPFFDAAWPAGLDGKEQFWTEFHDQLATSAYWQDLDK